MRRAIPVLLLFSTAAFAAGPFYLGSWKITDAKPAPWVKTGQKPGNAESKQLLGKLVVFKPEEIAAPRQLACQEPHYQVKDYPAIALFQGAFGEMKRRDGSADPEKLAAKLGFQGNSWKTLETGCSIEIDWHFLDESTAMFALNDYVYTLKKQ